MRAIAASTVAWSLVGSWTASPASLNATTPMTTPSGRASTMDRAAAFAASMRVGLTSSAAIDPETSNSSIIVPSSRGRPTTARGLALGGGPLEPLPEPAVARVDLQLLAGLRVGDHHEPHVGQDPLPGVGEPDGEQLVPPVEQVELRLPAGLADEVGHDHDQRP